MSSSTSLLDTISSSQASKEVTANAMFDAASQVMLFGRRATTTSALTWGFYGGRMLVDGVLTAIANGTVALTGSTTNYVEATRAGVVSKNTTGFTAGQIPLYTIVTGVSTVTSYTDERAPIDPAFMTHQVSFAVTSGDVTLTAAQARARHLTTTGVLTGNRNVILPNNGFWLVFNNNTGAYTTTFKTSGGTGISVTQGTRAVIFADGTNVVLATTDMLVAGSAGVGYAVGSGGAVTQATSRTTGVTLNKTNGAITLVSAAGQAGWQSFTVTNSLVAATDTIIVNQKSGTDKNMIHVTAVAAGSFEITFATTGGTTVEQPVFNFAVVKAVAS